MPFANKDFLKSRFFLISFFLSVLLNGCLWFLLYWRIKPAEEPITLHYNIYFGPDLIGEWTWVFAMPAVGAAIIVINVVLAAVLDKSRILGHLAMGIAVLTQIFLLIAGAAVVLANF